MTTQPKFVPSEAAELKLGENAALKLRLVDCVGDTVDGALGHEEDGMPRMVQTPWSTEDPFEQAAEIGTRKVIEEHFTVGIVMTTDGQHPGASARGLRPGGAESHTRASKTRQALHRRAEHRYSAKRRNL